MYKRELIVYFCVRNKQNCIMFALGVMVSWLRWCVGKPEVCESICNYKSE